MIKKNLKFLYAYQVLDFDIKQGGAAQTHIYYVISGMQKLGHYVKLLTPGTGCVHITDRLRGNEDPNRNIIKLPVSSSFWFRFFESPTRRLQTVFRLPYLGIFESFRMYEGILQSLPINLLYERYNLLCLGGAFAAHKLGIPYILEINGDMIAEFNFMGKPLVGIQHKYASWAMQYVLDAASIVVCPTQDLVNHLYKKWRLSEAKIVVIPNAANVELIINSSGGLSWRKCWGIKDKHLIIMYVGGFYIWHGLEMLVDAFVAISQQIPHVFLVLVGDGHEREHIEDYVRAKSISDRVVFAGRFARDQIPSVLNAADLFVYTGVDPGWAIAPLKIFEYMAAGKAIVAQTVNGIKDILEDGKTAILVPPCDVFELTSAIKKLLENVSLRHQLGKNAQIQVINRYSWKTHVQKLEQIILNILY